MQTGLSIGLLRPIRITGLEIVKADKPIWSEDEKAKLRQAQMQGSLFDELTATQQVKELRKIPFDFYYHFACVTADGVRSFKNKIVDWEAGALYWNCVRDHGTEWEYPFRARLEGQLAGRELMFLMGNQHRFQDQWLIISLIYPPIKKGTPQPRLL